MFGQKTNLHLHKRSRMSSLLFTFFQWFCHKFETAANNMAQIYPIFMAQIDPILNIAKPMVCHSPRCYHCLFSLQSLFLEDLDSTEPKRDETNWEFCTFLNLSLSLSFSFSLSLSLSFFNKEASWKMYFFIYEQSWWDWSTGPVTNHTLT